MGDSLYGNSLWLLANCISMSLFGLLFWMLVTSFFKPIQVGLATTLIASAEFLITLGLLGMDTAIIRFMHVYGGRLIKSAFVYTGLLAALLSVIFVFFVNEFQPQLHFVKHIIPAHLFVIFVVLYLYFKLLSSIFVGQNNAKLVFFKGMIFNFLKILGLFGFLYLGIYGSQAFGIFTSWMFAAATAFFLMFPLAQINGGRKFETAEIKKVTIFSGTNCIANFLELVPETLIPVLITAILSPFHTAFYYLDWMIASVIFFIPISMSKNMLASKSNDNLRKVIKALKFSFFLLIPVVIFVLLFSNLILSVFGEIYSIKGAALLRVLALSSIPFAINIIYIALMNVKHNMKAVILTHFLLIAGTLVLSYILIDMGIIAVGLGWLISQSVGAIVLAPRILPWKG